MSQSSDLKRDHGEDPLRFATAQLGHSDASRLPAHVRLGGSLGLSRMPTNMDEPPKTDQNNAATTGKRLNVASGKASHRGGPVSRESLRSRISDKIDKGIELLIRNVLPESPFLLIPTPNAQISQYEYPWELEVPPFTPREVQQRLQYMTLLSGPVNRGVTYTKGEWQEEDTPQSGLRSGTATPRSEIDQSKSRVKMSLSSYNAIKKASSSSQPLDPIAQKEREEALTRLKVQKEERARLEQQKKVETTKATTVTERSRDVEKVLSDPHTKSASQENHVKTQLANGRESSQKLTRDAAGNPSDKSMNGEARAPEKPKLKRSLDESSMNSAEKRIRVEPHSLSSSVRPDMHFKASPFEKSLSPTRSSTDAREPAAASSHREDGVSKIASHASKQSSKTSHTLSKMPPLLSPLPEGLTALHENDDSLSISTQPILAAKSPAQKGLGKPLKPPVVSKGLSLPPLLSPTLPVEIETALARLQSSSSSSSGSTHARSTVERAHERSRQPDTPGVARKTAKVKNKAAAPQHDTADDHASIEKVESKVIRLKYRRRNVVNVERILKMRPSPGNNAKGHSAEATAPVDKKRVIEAETNKPGRAEEKKRVRSDDVVEPAAKRPKIPASRDAARPHTPLPASGQSPPPTAAKSMKSVFGTPKKGEAMSRLGSNDGVGRTPQAAASTPRPVPTSTPASTERSKHNEGQPVVDGLRATESKYSAMGTTLKRRMDAILKKDKEAPALTDDERKLAAVTGLESIAAYLLGFHAKDRHLKHHNSGEHWDQLLTLLPFVHQRCRGSPELQALALLSTAITREALNFILVERLAAETPSTSTEYLKLRDSLVSNARARLAVWKDFAASAGDSSSRMGCASGMAEVANHVVNGIQAYCKKERVAWERTLNANL